jgi:hypothetical protein
LSEFDYKHRYFRQNGSTPWRDKLNLWQFCLFLFECFGTFVTAREPIDNEDDPNLLVERGNFHRKRKNSASFSPKQSSLRNHHKRFSRVKRYAVKISVGDLSEKSSDAENRLHKIPSKIQSGNSEETKTNSRTERLKKYLKKSNSTTRRIKFSQGFCLFTFIAGCEKLSKSSSVP